MNKNSDFKLKLEKIVCDFFKSKKNSNCLLEIEELFLSKDEECVLSIFPILVDVFSKLFSMGVLSASTSDDNNNEYKVWLLERYKDFILHMLSYLSHSNKEIQISSLQSLLSLVKLESEYPKKDEKENQNFPFTLFKRIVAALTSDALNQHNLIKVFQEYTKYHDIKLYLLKAIDSLLSQSQEVSELFLQNCFLLLYSLKFPKNIDCTQPVETYAYRQDSLQPFLLKEKSFRKFFSSVWNCLLSYELSSEFLQKVLTALSENVLPHLQNPCLMTDFLTNCYNKGGVLSLLALRGLYILMDNYNLEYPDFFVKLYALLDENIINGKFSSRFFELSDLFLSSTHLPAHVVASFTKKLSRLSLISSTDNILKILRILTNLLANHPSLVILIHQTDFQECQKDPFNFDAVDPAETNAMNSSLWEVKALCSHVNPDVSCKAKELTAAYPKLSSTVSEISSTSLQDLYRKLRKRKLDDVPLALLRPSVKQKRIS